MCPQKSIPLIFSITLDVTIKFGKIWEIYARVHIGHNEGLWIALPTKPTDTRTYDAINDIITNDACTMWTELALFRRERTSSVWQLLWE